MYRQSLVVERIRRMLVDWAAVAGAALLAVWLRHAWAWAGATSGDTPWGSYVLPAVMVGLLTVGVLKVAGAYSQPGGRVPPALTVAAIGVATLAMVTVGFFYRSASYSRAAVVIFLPLAAIVLAGARAALHRYVRAARANADAVRRVLIVGRTPLGNRLSAALRLRPAYYHVVGFLDDDVPPSGSENNNVPVLGGVDLIGTSIDLLDIDEVLIALSGPTDRVMDVIGECMQQGVPWKAVPHTYGLRLDRMWIDDFDGIPLVGTRGSRLIGYNRVVKRTFDVLVAGAALLFLSPVLLLVAAAVRITSHGPVLYRQARVGLDGQEFEMLKFRSMRTDSTTDIHTAFTNEWIHGRTGGDEAGDDTIHKIDADPRVTVVGRVIRATSIDELPQFWNVLRGDMSVVGPRPPLPYEVDHYTEWHRRRLSVLPGITGSWQVSGRNTLSFDEMVALDVAYIEGWSLERDLSIVLRTIPAMLIGR